MDIKIQGEIRDAENERGYQVFDNEGNEVIDMSMLAIGAKNSRKCPVCLQGIAREDRVKLACPRCLSMAQHLTEDFVLFDNSVLQMRNPNEKKFCEFERESWKDRLRTSVDKVNASLIISMGLEKLRVQEQLTDPKLTPQERKQLTDALGGLAKQINNLQEQLGAGMDTEENKSFMSIFNKLIQQCREFRRENELLYEGMMYCPDFKKVSVVKSNFISFNTYVLMNLKKISEDFLLKFPEDKEKPDRLEFVLEELYKLLSHFSEELYEITETKSIEKNFTS
jgi:hypothetical protein